MGLWVVASSFLGSTDMLLIVEGQFSICEPALNSTHFRVIDYQ